VALGSQVGQLCSKQYYGHWKRGSFGLEASVYSSHCSLLSILFLQVEEWKRVIEHKDQQIIEFREQALELKQQLSAMSIDSERARLAALEMVSCY